MRKRLAAPLLASLVGGCVIGSGDGGVTFGYVILTQDPNDPTFAQNGQDGTDPNTFVALDCLQAGADTILFRGLDQQGNTLAAEENACNSVNDNGDLTADELGIFLADLPPGVFASFAIELRANGQALPIRALEEDATQLGDPTLFGDFLFFPFELPIDAGIVSDLDFLGAGQLGADLDGDGFADASELQLFVPFQ
jgi:hypothetical protein